MYRFSLMIKLYRKTYKNLSGITYHNIVSCLTVIFVEARAKVDPLKNKDDLFFFTSICGTDKALYKVNVEISFLSQSKNGG